MKLVKEILYEKFTEDSDSIKDMGIGIYGHRDFKSKKKFIEWLLIIMPYILKTNGIPEDILKHGGYINSKHFNEIHTYLKQRISFKGMNIADSSSKFYFWPEELKNILLEKGYKQD